MPVLRILSGPKTGFFAPTHCPDKPEIWHGRAPRAKYHICRGRYVGIQPPKLLKFGILSINLLPQGRIVCTIFLRNSQRLYASTGSFYLFFNLVTFGGQITKL